jgi:5-methylthioadenosine/S-adenosylhomocysteine deaminase
MKILFKNAALLPEFGSGAGSGSARNTRVAVVVDGGFFTYVGSEPPGGEYDRIIDCRGRLLMPAFYNTHCHAAMTLFRGYADDLPLLRWLTEKILPAEERLDYESVYWASLLAATEMIRGGIVSFSDMYMFEDATARAVLECGMKANLARGLVSFDESADPAADRRFSEAVALRREYEGAGGGRIKVDMALHAEYTNTKKYCRYVAGYCRENSIRMQIHLSETKEEHERCIKKYGMTPAAFFEEAGVFDLPVTAAHCIWLSDEDIRLLAERQVFVSHNPTSNLKLGSGIMPYEKIKASGIKVSLGTDGAASNNNLSILNEMRLASLLHKGVSGDAAAAPAHEIIECATLNGALAQGRGDCGRIAAGYRADAILVDLDNVNTLPAADPAAALVYSADRSNVDLTMCDGVILYEEGEYTSIDVERVKFNAKRAASAIFG